MARKSKDELPDWFIKLIIIILPFYLFYQWVTSFSPSTLENGDLIVATVTDDDGNTSEFSAKGNGPLGLEKITSLKSLTVYPNPFNSRAIIEFDLIKTSQVSIIIYDILGHHVRSLLNNSSSAGLHQITWDGYNELNNKVRNGIYLIVIIIDGRLENTYKISYRK